MTLPVSAQDAATSTPPVDDPASQENITTMETMKVVAPRPQSEPLDLYRFRNPVHAESTRFGEAYQPPRSPEEIGMQGGIVQIGINYALRKTAQAIRHMPGWKDQVQDAVARPPPLSPDQLQRASHACNTDAPEVENCR